VDKKSRTFTPWSHVVALLFAQLSAAISLNDICDNLFNHQGLLSTIRGAVFPRRNTLSNANKERDAEMAKDLFWNVLNHFEAQSPGFKQGPKKRKRPLPRRFTRTIHIVDSSTIKLVANNMDWAKHRRRKAAAKLHLRLNARSFLPGFAIVKEAKQADNRKARELCAHIEEGEIVIFDKAYVDFEHLHDLNQRGINWVTRAKSNMAFRVKKRLLKKPEKGSKILRDDLIILRCDKSKKAHPKPLRRIVALVKVDGKEVKMEFITNNEQWAAPSVCDLYQSRWSIEVFFKQIKQNLKLADFLGNNANAVRWQVWMALLAYVLLRYLSYLSDWSHSFSRLCTMVRGVLWEKLALRELLESCGTAAGSFHFISRPDQAYLPDFEPNPVG